jgi:uncharacterized repeat protein (TIGR01451 family)
MADGGGMLIRSLRTLVLLAAFMSAAVVSAHVSDTDPLVFESTAQGSAGGGVLLSTHPSGYSFRVIERTHISEVGVLAKATGGTRTFYAAIHRLGTPWSIADIAGDSGLRGVALLTVSPSDTGDAVAPLDLTLEPGWYALVAGTGRYGADAPDSSVTLANTGMPVAANTFGPYTLDPATNGRVFQAATLRLFLRGQALPPPSSPTAFLLQTALPSAWWPGQSYQVDADWFRGAKFTIDRPVLARHVRAWAMSGSGTLFGAIVRLASPAADPPLPGSTAFADAVVASTLINVGTAADEYVGDFDDVALAPGSYAVVVGSGLFGASGSAQLLGVQELLVPPLVWAGPSGFWTSFSSYRIVLDGFMPEIETAPAALAFGDVPFGLAATRTLTVRNLREGDLHLTGIGIAGDPQAQFTLEPDAGACATATLPAHGECTFGLRYTPAVLGDASARVVIESDGEPTPYEVVLGGRAVVSHTVTPAVQGHGAITPDTPQIVAEGGVAAFTLAAESGYHFSTIGSGCAAVLNGTVITTVPVFSDCTLTAIFAIDPPSTLAASGGTPQSTTVDSTFAEPLRVRVSNAAGIGVPGVVVHFAVPAEGASAVVPASAVSGVDGIASVAASANTIAGHYVVQASVAGLAGEASFALENLAGPAAHLLVQSGGAQGTIVGTPFAAPLAVRVTDAHGNAVAGVDVAYAAPSAGASATLSAATATTATDGTAAVGASANAIIGTYAVDAGIAGVPAVAFTLENLPPDVALSLAIGDDRDYAAYGDVLEYMIVVHNAGSMAAGGIDVAATLPPVLDEAAATWACLDAGTGACAASGTGALADHGVRVPPGGSVTYLLSVPVRADATEADAESSVGTLGAYPGEAASATDTTQLVLFRDGFDAPVQTDVPLQTVEGNGQ